MCQWQSGNGQLAEVYSTVVYMRMYFSKDPMVL